METIVSDHIIIGKETTYGTPVTPAIVVPLIRGGGGMQTDPQFQDLALTNGNIAGVQDVTPGGNNHTGDFNIAPQFDVLGHILQSILGAPSSATKSGESIVYEHTFTEKTTKVPYTLEQKVGALCRRWAGVIFSSLTLTAEVGNLTLQVGAIGKSNATQATPVTPSPSTQKQFNYDNIAVSIDSSVVAEVQKLEMKYDAKAALQHTLNSSKDPYGYTIDPSMLEITMEILLESSQAAEYQAMLNETEKRLDIDLTGSATIGTASNNALNIGIPVVRYKASAPVPVAAGASILPITAVGVSRTGSFFDQFLLTNLTATY